MYAISDSSARYRQDRLRQVGRRTPYTTLETLIRRGRSRCWSVADLRRRERLRWALVCTGEDDTARWANRHHGLFQRPSVTAADHTSTKDGFCSRRPLSL
jgi:hypothetical protein